jgi:hypothetical protein
VRCDLLVRKRAMLLKQLENRPLHPLLDSVTR